MTELLVVENLVKHFPLGHGRYVAAVNDVTFAIERGSTLGLVGESGSGKTTVGRCVLRLLATTSGKVVFDGLDLQQLSNASIRRLRRQMQVVFQEPYGSLDPRQRVGSAIEEPLHLLVPELARASRASRVAEVLSDVGLDVDTARRYPIELTASEQQRVNIARAIVTRPNLVVLDEPTSALDPSVRGQILELLLDLQQRLGLSYLFISHDLTAVERVSHKIAVMYLGKIVELGSTDQVLRRFAHPYSSALLTAVLHPDPQRRAEPFLLKGEIPTAVNPSDQCPLVERCPFAISACRETFPAYAQVERGHLTACLRYEEIYKQHLAASSDENDFGRVVTSEHT